MSTAAVISIKLDAQTATLKKGFQETRNEVRSLGQQVRQSVGAGVVRFQAWLSSIQAVGGALANVFSMLRMEITRVSELGDIADRLGLDVERFQQLQAVTEQFGANADNLAISLQRMNRRIADAARSGGPLADIFERAGKDIQSIARLRPDEQFLELSDAINETALSGDQLATAFKFLDTEGAAFVTALREGSGALEEMMAEMGDGVTITREQVEQAQRLEARLLALERRFDTLRAKLALGLGPVLEATLIAFERIANAIERVERAANRLGLSAIASWLPLFGSGSGGDAPGVGAPGLPPIPASALSAAAMPMIGAATATTVQGFSTLQQLQRENRRERWEDAMLAAMRRLIRVSESGPSFTEVTL